MVNELLASTAFLSVCSCIKSMLEDVDWVINRLKAERNIVNYSGHDSNRSIPHLVGVCICCDGCFLQEKNESEQGKEM